MSEERPPQSDAIPEHDNQPEEPAHDMSPEPMEPVPVDSDTPQSSPSPEEAEAEELRKLREAAARGELVLTPEQAKRWQHALGLPDAAMPANDNEPGE